MVLKVLLVLIVLWFLSVSPSSILATYSTTQCQRRCGNVDIPYPFGIMGDDPKCSRNQWFNISCEKGGSNTPPIPKLRTGLFTASTVEVMSISVPQGQMRVRSVIREDCSGHNSTVFLLTDIDNTSPYILSSTSNKFTAIGCDFLGILAGFGEDDTAFINTCFSYCSRSFRTAGFAMVGGPVRFKNGECNGAGCCQFPISDGLKQSVGITVTFGNATRYNDYSGGQRGKCRYVFLVEHEKFKFNTSYLNGTKPSSKDMQVVVEWAAGNETCEEARNKKDYACRSKYSYCYNSTNGPGYRCNCSKGYQGNPYLDDQGCKDINECEENNPCHEKAGCANTNGGYTCTCQKGTHGDGKRHGEGCKKDEFPIVKVVLGVGISFLFLLIGTTWTHWLQRKRKIMKLKEKFFQQNGGMLLQQKISSRGGDKFKIFTTKELEQATDKYNSSNIVGQGGYGIVYKGVLPDNGVVAIKKSKMVEASQIEQFINELDILSQVNHRNVVKLLGCCLEAEVPILVYEFIANGTLSDHIHNHATDIPSMSLENRLRIAEETADALAYLHSAASMPIFHRDVKSTNILLDDKFTAKISDFGASRLVLIDQTQITTLVQGTLGYLDPEYFQTGQLTAKSDVYSFGVVLVELLTGEKPVCFNRSQEERNLAMHFILAMKDNRLFQVLDDQVLNEGQEEQLMAVGRLAKRCLGLKGEKRPTMKEVVVELQRLRRFQLQPWVNNSAEEAESSLMNNPDMELAIQWED